MDILRWGSFVTWIADLYVDFRGRATDRWPCLFDDQYWHESFEEKYDDIVAGLQDVCQRRCAGGTGDPVATLGGSFRQSAPAST